MHPRRIALALAASVGIVLLAVGPSGGAPLRGDVARNGPIAFADYRRDFDLFAFDVSTRRRIRLTLGLANDVDPALSPDGSRVAFVRAGATNDLMMLDVANKSVRRLTRSTEPIVRPTWSPDGLKIAWASRDVSAFGVYVVNIDGTNARRLTRGSALAQDPAWSPDGSRIAFARGGGIWTVDSDGSAPERELIPYPFPPLREPAWSPDGARLAMRSESSSVKSGNSLLVANADGSSLRSVPLTREFRSDPLWTRDARIQFRLSRRSYSDIYSVSPDGTGLRRVARLAASGPCPGYVVRWAGIDSRMVFSADVSDCTTIYSVRSDGSGLRRITAGPAIEPAYSANGRRLAFLDPQHSRIYVTQTRGGRPREVARMARGSIYRAPSWSPDGSQLVFSAGQTIWILDVDRKALRRLPGTGPVAGDPDWGPNGLIAFVRGGKTADIWITSSTGGLLRRVKRNAIAPDWSPNGRRLAYLRADDPADEYDVGVVDVATGRARRLTRTPNAFEGSPRWSPDGRLIAYERGVDRIGASGIVLMTPRGTHRRLIAACCVGEGESISWQPLPR